MRSALVPKISCICITHDRLEMFRRAKRCFLSQTYSNKELVVLFENDVATEEYIDRNRDFLYHELTQNRLPGAIYLELSTELTNFFDGSAKVQLRDEAGFFFNAVDGRWQRCETVESGDLMRRSDFEFEIDNFYQNKFCLRRGATWLNYSCDQGFYIQSSLDNAQKFGFTVNLDCSISLIIQPTLDYFPGDLRHIGWEKTLLHRGTRSDVVFYKIMSKQKLTLGMKRNLSIRVVNGDYICVWDDDDWYSEKRLSNQIAFLRFTGKQACSLANTIFFDANTGNVYQNLLRVTGHENTLLFRNEIRAVYDNRNSAEDTPLLLDFYNRNQLSVMEDRDLYIYNFHKKNTCASSHFNIIVETGTLLEESEAKRVRALLGFVPSKGSDQS